jgi:hypothetical protein
VKQPRAAHGRIHPQVHQAGSYILEAWAKLPNGTKIAYGASANLSAYPTQITDPNGNYITITYVNN